MKYVALLECFVRKFHAEVYTILITWIERTLLEFFVKQIEKFIVDYKYKVSPYQCMYVPFKVKRTK